MELFNKSPLTTEQLAEIRKLHFSTKKLVNMGIAGDYRSAFRGRGIEFEEVREYVPGDDVRTIDWKVTARTNLPYVKSYREERDLTVMIAVDVSGSTRTGTKCALRESVIAQIGAVLTLIALNNNDKVGLITFSDKLETYHPPRKGRGAVWRILKEVLNPSAYGEKTDLSAMCLFLNTVLKRRAIVFLLSDFIATGFEQSLGILGKRHDVTAVVTRDPIDRELPKVGLVTLTDPESKNSFVVDSSSHLAQKHFDALRTKLETDLKTLLRKHKIGCLQVSTDLPFMPQLHRYFEERSSS